VTYQSQIETGKFNLASALSGFAIGAVAVAMSFWAINPNGSSPTASTAAAPSTSSDSGGILLPGTDGGTVAAPPVGQTKTLSDGTTLQTKSDGTVVATDTSGKQHVITTGGSAAVAGHAVGGTSGTAGSAGVAGSSGSSTSGGTTGGASGSGSGAGGGGSGECGAGGATDTGVTANSVLLGATVAESGIAKAFLGEARQGIEAYKNRINSSGGVCGRKLTVKYVDDGWSPTAGQQDLQNLINEDKVFAIAVSPSSEGVNAASQAGVFKNAGVPVVGTDGLDASQYKDPYIWPVASATVTMLHVMMKNAWDHGLHNPAIVFDNQYKFGVEGARAFESAYERLSGGKKIPGSGSSSCGSGSRYCGISAGTGQYGNQVSIINRACGGDNPCDYLVLLMEPDTAEQWMATPGAPTVTDTREVGLAQPLFTYEFGKTCGDKCDGMEVWTGYNPPIGQFAGTAGVKQYVGDLKGQNSGADAFNQFTEGSYLGMQLLVEAMQKVGGNLTRDALKTTLDSMNLNTGLSAAAEVWSPGKH
jgi:ABC-type branched-subunit amino acid transport system substrate-binding protein